MLLIVSPLIIIFLLLIYYQLFYKSPRVDSGVAIKNFAFHGHTAQLRGVRFFPVTHDIVSGSVDSTVKIWRQDDGAVIRIFKHPSGVSSLDLSDDGQMIVTGSYDGIVRLWQVSDGQLLKQFNEHRGTVWSVDISKDNQFIVSAGDDAVVRTWNTQTGQLNHALPGHSRTVWSVRISPDGKHIASASYDFTIKIWNRETGTIEKTLTEHSETVVDIAISHDGKLLASTSDDKTVRLWQFPGGVLKKTMHVAEHVQAVAFSPDDKRLLTGGRDKPMIGEFLQEIFGNSEYNKGVSMRLWDVASGKLLQTFSEHTNDVNDVAYSQDGKSIASASDDHSVHVYRVMR